MTQVFCTLKEAADKLETTEAEIELMLNSGVLREFRDGSRRLLRLSDLAGLVVATRPPVGGVPRDPRSSHAEIDKQALTPPEPEIRLPRTATVTVRARHSGGGTTQRGSRPAAEPSARRRVPHAATIRKPGAAQRCQSPPRAVVVSPSSASLRPRPHTNEMSLRQWLWTGLVDDNPLAIFIIFGIVLLGAAALAGAIYLLTQAP